MYDQPANSIQVAFFGASNMLSAVSPTYMYDQYGINGYNCATSVQPPIMTYYLFKDLLQTQGDSLKLVVIDPSVLLRSTEEGTKPQWGERVIVNMKMSPVKVEAIMDFSALHGLNPVEQLLCIIKYHSRWQELTPEDFDLSNNVSKEDYSRGEYLRYNSNVDFIKTAGRSSKTNGSITDSQDFSSEELEAMWYAPAKQYLDKTVELCKSRGIDVLFVKTPRTGWNDKSHDSLAHLAEIYDVPYLELSTESVMQQCDLTYGFDFVDEKHPNIRGSEKITNYLGRYILDTFGSFPEVSSAVQQQLKGEIEKYKRCREDAQLVFCDNLMDYLDLIYNERYTAIIAIRGDGASGMTDEVRAKLLEKDLDTFAQLEPYKAYVGVIHHGKVLREKTSLSVGGRARMEGEYENGKVKLYNKRVSIPGDDSTIPSLSVGSYGGDVGNVYVKVGRRQGSEKRYGVNIVVYNDETGERVDNSCFDASNGYKRTSDKLPEAA